MSAFSAADSALSSQTPPDSPGEPSDSASRSPQPAHGAHGGRRPIRCDCGRELLVKVDRARVILRCPVHGVQFRYTAVDK